MILSLRDRDIADKYRTEGIEIGMEKERYKIIYNMLDILDNEQIAKSTGLTIEEVEHIRAEYDSTKGQ